MPLFVFTQNVVEDIGQAFGRIGRQDHPVRQLNFDRIIGRDVPGAIGAKEQFNLFPRPLDVHDIGEIRRHAAVIPQNRGFALARFKRASRFQFFISHVERIRPLLCQGYAILAFSLELTTPERWKRRKDRRTG